MLWRTHIAVGIFIVLFFLPLVEYKMIFTGLVLFCSLLPDIDMSQSYMGRSKIFRPLQWTVKHRGLFHSFTFAGAIAIILVFYFPIASLGFFLGYGGHLIVDSLTHEGIRPFWPYKNEIKWKIRTGGKREKAIFYTLMMVNVFLLIRLIL
jgi:membrane-bound metal-dependent hydrolase YbcI (DUF457 family)